MDLLDKDVIDEVCDALGRDAYADFARRMLDELDRDLAAYSQHLATGSFADLSRAAHRAAGSAVSVGADGLHRLLKQVELAATTDQAAQTLPALVAQIPALITLTRNAILAEVKAA